MLKDDTFMENTISEIHNTIFSCKSSLRTSAMLKTLEAVSTGIDNPIRLTTKHKTISRFNRVRESSKYRFPKTSFEL